MAPSRLRTPAKPLEPVREWLVGKPQKLENLKGAPFLLHFWSIDCALCHDHMHRIASWEEKFGPRGLNLVSIHEPMTSELPDDDFVLGMFQGHELTHPLAIDDTGDLAVDYGVTGLPAYFLYDAEGLLRHFHAGQNSDITVEAAIRRLLDEHEGASPAAP